MFASIYLLIIGSIVLVTSDDPNRLPTRCESNIDFEVFLWFKFVILYCSFSQVCKYLTEEMSESLTTHNSPELIETAYSLDERLDKKKAKKYRDS